MQCSAVAGVCGTSVMSKCEEYRRNAALCQRRADESTNEDDKRQWLRLVQSWLGLMWTDLSVKTFDAETRAKGPGGTRSSH
jgi:hypothetical protein